MAKPHDFDEIMKDARRQAEEWYDSGALAAHPAERRGPAHPVVHKVRVKQFRLDDEGDCELYGDILTKAATPDSGYIIRREEIGRDGSANAVVVLIWMETDMSAVKKAARERMVTQVAEEIGSMRMASSRDHHPKLIPEHADSGVGGVVSLEEVKKAMLRKASEAAPVWGPDALAQIYPHDRAAMPASDDVPATGNEEYVVSQEEQMALNKEFERFSADPGGDDE